MDNDIQWIKDSLNRIESRIDTYSEQVQELRSRVNSFDGFVSAVKFIGSALVAIITLYLGFKE